MKGGGFSKGLKSQLRFLVSAHPTMTHCHFERTEESLTNRRIVGSFCAESILSSRKMNLSEPVLNENHRGAHSNMEVVSLKIALESLPDNF